MRPAMARSSSLALALNGFEAQLAERGYKASTKRRYLRICGDFCEYLAQELIDPAQLDDDHIEAFLRVKSRRRHRQIGSRKRKGWLRPLRHFLQHLRHAPAAPVDAQPLPANPASRELLEGFVAFTVSHRGLSQSTVGGYTHCIDRFLQHTGIDSQEALRRLSVAQIDRFLLEASRGRARSTVYVMCSAVRAFLRYAHVCGLLDKDLGGHVSTPRIYSMERLPRFLVWADVERTLASPERSTLIGCRDYGILVLLALCGLRSGEVAALALADVDWRRDAIRLRRPKSNRTEHVPLVPAVGEALMKYVRRRPPAPFPELFLKVLAPVGPMTRAGIGQVVKGHLRRAGVKAPHWGGHTLRHSHAAELLRRGFPLKTIGDVLGHHHPDSTFIYAKTAVDELRELCLDVEAVLP